MHMTERFLNVYTINAAFCEPIYVWKTIWMFNGNILT